MNQGPKQEGGRGVNSTIPAQGSESSLSHPTNLKPWEDRSLAPDERLTVYKDFVREKVADILATVDRFGGDPSKTLEIRDAPETQRWMRQARWVQGVSAEEFCHRMDYPPEVRELLGKNFLGSDEWRSQRIDVGIEPPIPMSLTRELLESECPLHPGVKIKDTHLLVLVPKTANGEPYTPLKLDELCATRKGSGSRLIHSDFKTWKSQPWASVPQSESEWALIPKSDPDPDKVPEEKHFREKNIAAQQKAHQDYYREYREAKALELMTAALLNDLVNGEPRMLDGWDNYLRCIEPNASGGRVCAGFFRSGGLAVFDNFEDRGHRNMGRAIVWKS